MGYRLCLLCVLPFFLLSCGDLPYPFNDFAHSDSNKTEIDFNNEAPQCWSEKDKHSHKIEGRKFGFKGQDTGYLGCMKLKGWNHIVTPSGDNFLLLNQNTESSSFNP